MSKTVVVGTRVPEGTAKKINEAVERGLYLTPGEFLRAALERELERTKEVA